MGRCSYFVTSRAQALVSAACLAGVLLSLLFAARAAHADATAQPFSVAAYLPEWRYEGADFDMMAQTLTHLILFSLEPTAKGKITSRDRLPRPLLLKDAREATRKHGCRLLVCFGGNGRSAGFQGMVRSKTARKRFVGELMKLLEKHQLDGVDYNWEYPGFSFSQGYLPEADVQADYAGLAALVKETREAFATAQEQAEAVHIGNPDSGGWFPDSVTLAYYPDTRQERQLASHRLLDPKHGAHLLHAMAYDTNGGHEGHSSLSYGRKCLAQAAQALSTPGARGAPSRVTLGVPFYGRFLASGDWRSYEDIIVHLNAGRALAPEADSLEDKSSGGTIAFNGPKTIRSKVADAVEAGAGGVMIWEVGQDCRRREVRRSDRPPGEKHTVTCPDAGASLLLAMHEELDARGIARLLRTYPSPIPPNSTSSIGSGEQAAAAGPSHHADEL